jgi:hypothetical protein
MLTGVLPIELDIKILGYLSFSELLNLYYNAYWIKVHLKEEIHCILLKRWKNTPEWIEWLTSKVFLNGDLDSLRWLHEMNTPVSWSDISSISAHSGYLHILIWMKCNFLFINDDIVEMCVIGDCPTVLEWCETYDADKVLELAIERGSVKIIQFLKNA